MDLRMPVLEGYAATAQIRQWEAAQQCGGIPLIALTADVYKENRDQCLAADTADQVQ